MNKQLIGIGAGIVGLFALAACGQGGTTVSGQTGKNIDVGTISTIACALAQVAGNTAGTIAGDISGVNDSTKTAIKTANQITTDACAALARIIPPPRAKASSVSATVVQ